MVYKAKKYLVSAIQFNKNDIRINLPSEYTLYSYESWDGEQFRTVLEIAHERRRLTAYKGDWILLHPSGEVNILSDKTFQSIFQKTNLSEPIKMYE